MDCDDTYFLLPNTAQTKLILENQYFVLGKILFPGVSFFLVLLFLDLLFSFFLLRIFFLSWTDALTASPYQIFPHIWNQTR
ncbi:hypothetical protein A3C67_03030 [Candidatus Nomurabacteria bacterium RIFCSPHIGHO2_02_FULL_42_19]|uniref:Uncharacterized protein n=1 Tax=Candidatus Nomurabacteria bacterium RIFCSPHIGHO2_02_FULL_42_19 TaxID=1801756 RepID=A0A1F6W1F3_9BACT|nr:MAG: hypothetical protein A3C67_03030 [Candidatus Nomurabacteria bacterium RIFCSPHIGHO2_02_FULL_42_19]